eukprot:COSAG06_NODE_121_length_23085_cov_7.727791_13_plen_156_part_00
MSRCGSHTLLSGCEAARNQRPHRLQVPALLTVLNLAAAFAAVCVVNAVGVMRCSGEPIAHSGCVRSRRASPKTPIERAHINSVTIFACTNRIIPVHSGTQGSFSPPLRHLRASLHRHVVLRRVLAFSEVVELALDVEQQRGRPEPEEIGVQPLVP